MNWNVGATAVVNRSAVFYLDVTSSTSSWDSTNTINTLTGLTPGHTYVFYLQIHSYDKTARSVNNTVTTRESILCPLTFIVSFHCHFVK